MIELNPDGISIKGCSYIYGPAGQAGEYSALAANPYRGCGHSCAYCYVPNVIQMKRPDFDAGAIPRANFSANSRRMPGSISRWASPSKSCSRSRPTLTTQATPP